MATFGPGSPCGWDNAVAREPLDPPFGQIEQSGDDGDGLSVACHLVGPIRRQIGSWVGFRPVCCARASAGSAWR
ncbi:MAG: hypothetical protein ACRD9W_23875 [Terriglobia bacterium]